MARFKVKVLFLLLVVFLPGCNSSIDPDNVFAVVGSYQLIEYNAPNYSDDNPTGDVIIKRLDNQHVSIVVKGTSGKTKIAYSFSSVLIVSLDRDRYSLLVKGRSIGEAGSDGISRYLTLTPASNVTIKSMEF